MRGRAPRFVDLGSGERDVHDDHLSSPYVPGGTPVHRRPLTCSAAVLTVSDRNPAGGKAARRTPVAQVVADNRPREDDKPTYGATTKPLCGGFGLTEPLPDPARTLLPRLLRLDATTAGPAARLTPVLALLQQEAHGAQPGAQAIFAKITDVFVAPASFHMLPADSVPGPAPAAGRRCWFERELRRVVVVLPGKVGCPAPDRGLSGSVRRRLLRMPGLRYLRARPSAATSSIP